MHISTFHFKLKQVNLHLFLDGDPRLYIDGSESQEWRRQN